jgi:hypothetical protein
MSDLSREDADEGTIAVMLKQAVERRIPNLLSVKTRLLAGGTLADVEIMRLREILEHAQTMQRMADRHPEFHELSAKMAALYAEICETALQNEKKGEIKPDINLDP